MKTYSPSAASSIPAMIAVTLIMLFAPTVVQAGQLSAGVAKVDITDRAAGPVNDPLYVKALVVKDDASTVAIVTVDAVAIGELGRIKNDYLPRVRAALAQDFNFEPTHVLVNASHCHGVVCPDLVDRTVQAVTAAVAALTPVKVGAGLGHEDRIMENRRLRLSDGRETDVRHAYSLPPDASVAAIGPVDPQVPVLRLDRTDGRPLAVLYNFACHPIQGVPGGGNSADYPAFASKTIEENLPGATAFFLQGCAGDINPAGYKDVHHPRDAEPLGTRLGLSVLRAARAVALQDQAELRLVSEKLALPRAADYQQRLTAMEAQQARLLGALRGTSLNFETFLPLYVKYAVAGQYPSGFAHDYMREKAQGREDLVRLDAENRRNMEAYLRNIQTMEELTRVQTNINLLRMHQKQTAAAGSSTLDVEITALRIGDFALVTFPGELSVQIGLNIKQAAGRRGVTCVAAYTNGYIYYAPTTEQRRNKGWAQEDCDSLVAPEWQKLFEERALALLKRL